MMGRSEGGENVEVLALEDAALCDSLLPGTSCCASLGFLVSSIRRPLSLPSIRPSSIKQLWHGIHGIHPSSIAFTAWADAGVPRGGAPWCLWCPGRASR